jgi:hypothetical protein
LNEEAKMPNDNPKADVDISVTDELAAADTAVVSDGLRAYYVSQAGYYDFRPLAVFVREPQTGKASAGSMADRSSGFSTSPGFSCPRIGAALGSAAGCWRWRKKRVDDAAVVGSR